jgi:hypothetical protein
MTEAKARVAVIGLWIRLKGVSAYLSTTYILIFLTPTMKVRESTLNPFDQ